MNGEYFPQILTNTSEWSVDNFNNYEQSLLPSALIQVLHRTLAYIILLTGIVYIKKLYVYAYDARYKIGIWSFIILLVTQVFLGIITLINCIGNIPVSWGVLHQACALLLLSSALYLNYLLKSPSLIKN
jgi:heme a synthase